MKIIRNYGKTILMATAVFCFFAVITYLTPLAGDDWGYALNGMKGTPFSTAVEFYFSWSGRFFSELWGFLVAPNKWLWNILNPAFFTVIFRSGRHRHFLQHPWYIHTIRLFPVSGMLFPDRLHRSVQRTVQPFCPVLHKRSAADVQEQLSLHELLQ